MAKEKKTAVKDTDAALDDAISQIEKKFGKGSVMRLGDRTAVDVDVIPSGSLTLDKALGIVVTLKVVLSKYMVLNQVVRQLLHYMRLPRHKSRAVKQHSLMLNMLLILFMQRI